MGSLVAVWCQHGDAQDVDGAGAYLHDEQGVQLLQPDGVDVKEVGGEEIVGLTLRNAAHSL
ncbi:hypothetical protein [Saccharopolyspora shandongensis]|uniref:hypothetical protein n=1 Tax=Saccharopolyspora shandongensis TaxID=418495 RepID=UPI0033D33428